MQINYEFLTLIPFIGLLLSMAILPQLLHHAWEKHMGKIVFGWVSLSVILSLFQHKNLGVYLHAITDEYIPFISLIFALYSIASGMHLNLKLPANPLTNTAYLFCGSIIAGIIGTTGASLLLIRPFLNLNHHRKFKTHLGVFYIFTISNIGGAFSPLGDPPLFVGYLKGIDFFWPTLYLSLPTLTLLFGVLSIFCCLDAYFFTKEPKIAPSVEKFSFDGKKNLILLSLAVVLSFLPIPVLLRSLSLLFLGGVSFYITPLTKRHKWGFHMAPFFEIFKLFIGIFITIAPIIDILKLESATFLKILNSPTAFFWTTGLLSGILDNAPTYLVFFHIAGGNPQDLMTTNMTTLMAISLGAVFMGALTYIGNAPNLMVRSIAHHKGAKMPHFFGYMAWSCVILLPLFWCIQKIFLES